MRLATGTRARRRLRAEPLQHIADLMQSVPESAGLASLARHLGERHAVALGEADVDHRFGAAALFASGSGDPPTVARMEGATARGGRRRAMDIRKTVTLVEDIKREYGVPAREPLRRVAIASVFRNPLAGAAPGADLKPLIDYSLELGASLTRAALATLGAGPAQLRAYTKAALVGIGGDLEHGAAMIHPQLGMAMRRAIRRGRVIIPGHAKVGPAGTAIDLLYGPIDEGWDLDAFDSTPVLIHDAPRPDEIVLWLGYATGPRVNARSKGPDQKEVDALVASFQR